MRLAEGTLQESIDFAKKESDRFGKLAQEDGERARLLQSSIDRTINEQSSVRSRQQMIDADPVLQSIIDRYPDLKDSIERGDSIDIKSIFSKSLLLVSAGKMTSQEAKHLNEFMSSTTPPPR